RRRADRAVVARVAGLPLHCVRGGWDLSRRTIATARPSALACCPRTRITLEKQRQAGATVTPIYRALLVEAAADLRSAWPSLWRTDVAYKLLAFALLTPTASWLIYFLRGGTSDRVIADVDIAYFFLTTPAGIVTLLLGASLLVSITAVENASLMAVGFARAHGITLEAPGALRFGGRHALDVLRVAIQMVLRLVGGVIPFALAAGAVYLLLLRDYDINYYLSQRPPEFVEALAIAGLLGAA